MRMTTGTDYDREPLGWLAFMSIDDQPAYPTLQGAALLTEAQKSAWEQRVRELDTGACKLALFVGTELPPIEFTNSKTLSAYITWTRLTAEQADLMKTALGIKYYAAEDSWTTAGIFPTNFDLNEDLVPAEPIAAATK